MDKNQIDRMENMLTDLIKLVGIQNKDISDLKQDINGMKQEINGIKQEMNGMKQEMTGMKKEMTELNKKVDRIEKTVNSHTEILNSFKFDVDYIAEKQMKTDMKVNRIEKMLEF